MLCGSSQLDGSVRALGERRRQWRKENREEKIKNDGRQEESEGIRKRGKKDIRKKG
jgi:hypothetical protein